MIYPSIDKLLNQVGSKYLLVNIVAKRAHEIEKTEQILQKGVEIAPFNAELIYDLAAMQAMLGKNEESIENLLTALQLNKEQMKTNSNTKDIVPLLKKDARFEKLRSYPRFPQLD